MPCSLSRNRTMAKKRTTELDPSMHAETSQCHRADRLMEQLRELRLPAFRDRFQTLVERAAKEPLSHPRYLESLTELECAARSQGRIRRLASASRLPLGKTWDSFQWLRILKPAQHLFQALRDGRFLARKETVPVFGKPWSGKNARRVCRRRATRIPRPLGAVRNVQIVGAGPARLQAGSSARTVLEEVGGVRGVGDRRPRLPGVIPG